MNLYKNEKYLEDVAFVAGLNLPWEKLQGSSVMLSGATGQIGSFLVDVIMHKNICSDLHCKVYALGRNEEKAQDRFSPFYDSEYFQFVRYDVKERLVREDIGQVGFILHLASNTHPVQYASDPIGTILTNIVGTQNMLDFAVEHRAIRCLFASSVEVYGENRGDVEMFDEEYCGYLNANTMRAGYPESKRCGEALCQAYIKQKGLDIVISRLARSYGPTLLGSDTKAMSQFLHKALSGEDIVLKSAGNQYFSYTYIVDAVSGLLTVVLKGKYIVNGGDTGQDSIYNGLCAIGEARSDDDIVLIHDGNRPMVSAEIITDSLIVQKKYGDAVAAIPCTEVVFVVEAQGEESSIKLIERNNLRRTQTPHSYRIGDVCRIYEKAREDGIRGMAATCALMEYYGRPSHFSLGSEKNIKITTAEDIEIFKALLHAQKDSWMK